MKKLLFLFLTALAVSSQAFAKEVTFESWASFNVSYESLFAKGNGMKDLNTSALGLDLSLFQFVNNNPIGFFVHITHPLLLADNLGSGHRVYLLGATAFGPAFMYTINTNLTLQIGLAPEFKFFMIDNKTAKSSEANIIFGIVTDIGLKYHFTDVMFFNIGSTVSYGYANGREVQSETDEPKTFRQDFNGFVKNFSLVAFAPYIGIGFTTNGKNSVQMGRAPR